MRDFERINPNPRIVWFMNYAIDQVTARLSDEDEYAEWLAWASSWKGGRRSPADCVAIAHRCFEHKDNSLQHCLGQLAWGAKEACYSTQKSAWLVIRYIADAMLAFGVAFPDEGLVMLQPPTLDVRSIPRQPAEIVSALPAPPPDRKFPY